MDDILSKSYQHDKGGNSTRDEEKNKIRVFKLYIMQKAV